MPGGIWNDLMTTNPGQRSGFYINFMADALAGVQGGTQGVVAIPVTACWGPSNTGVEITSEDDLIKYFSYQDIGTAKYSIKQALKGAKSVLAYRMDNGGVKATLTLTDGSATNLVTLTLKYTGARPLTATVATSLVDGTKKELRLYEGTELLEKVTFAQTATDLVAKVNALSGYATATKLADGTLGNVSNASFAGGNNGSVVVASDYIKAMAYFETQTAKWNTFTLDGNSDASIQASCQDWIKRLRSEGVYVNGVFGGASAQTFADAKAQALSINHEGIVYSFIGYKYQGVTYSPAQMACRVAGLVAGKGASDSVTYAILDEVDELVVPLTNNEIQTANASGLMVAFHDGEVFRIEKGINTLTSYSDTQHEGWSKIKNIAVMDLLGNSMTRSALKNYIGKVDNDDDGQKTLIGALKDFLDMAKNMRLIKSGYWIKLDPARPSVGDKCFLLWSATPVDSMEEIYSTALIGR